MPVLTTLSNVVFSAYCACRICCGPNASGVTAAGTTPRDEFTIAAPRKYSLGTIVLVKTNKNAFKCRVEDRTAKKWDGKRWDIYFRDHEAAKKFGIQRGTVRILTSSTKKKK